MGPHHQPTRPTSYVHPATGQPSQGQVRYWIAVTIAVVNAAAGALLLWQGHSAQAMPMIALVGCLATLANLQAPRDRATEIVIHHPDCCAPRPHR